MLALDAPLSAEWKADLLGSVTVIHRTLCRRQSRPRRCQLRATQPRRTLDRLAQERPLARGGGTRSPTRIRPSATARARRCLMCEFPDWPRPAQRGPEAHPQVIDEVLAGGGLAQPGRSDSACKVAFSGEEEPATIPVTIRMAMTATGRRRCRARGRIRPDSNATPSASPTPLRRTACKSPTG